MKDSTERDSAAKDSTERDSAAKDSTERDSTAKDSTERDSAAKDPAAKDPVAKDKATKDKAAKGKKASQATYAQVIGRLEALVEAMEAGELPLEEALETFAEGVTLIKQGEKILAEAEQRVEQLLASGEYAPFSLEAPKATASRAAPQGEGAGEGLLL